MSLEQAITDHALALRELAAAIRSTISGASDLTAATDKVIADAKNPGVSGAKAAITDALDKAKAATKERAVAGKKEEPVVEKAKKEEPAADGEPLTYDDVKVKVLAMAQAKGRDTLVTLLKRHGADSAPKLLETQWPQFVKDIDAIMAGTYDPELSDVSELA